MRSQLNSRTVEIAQTMNRPCARCGAKPGKRCRGYRYGWGVCSGFWKSEYKILLPIGTFHRERERERTMLTTKSVIDDLEAMNPEESKTILTEILDSGMDANGKWHQPEGRRGPQSLVD